MVGARVPIPIVRLLKQGLADLLLFPLRELERLARIGAADVVDLHPRAGWRLVQASRAWRVVVGLNQKLDFLDQFVGVGMESLQLVPVHRVLLIPAIAEDAESLTPR